MPQGYSNDTGEKFKPPGKKSRNKKKKGPYWFDADVLLILQNQENATAYIQEAIREKSLRANAGKILTQVVYTPVEGVIELMVEGHDKPIDVIPIRKK